MNIKEKSSLDKNLIKRSTNNNGITLIALVLTVVIIVILAAVTVNVVLRGGLIERAKSSVDITASAMQEEQEFLDGVVDKYVNSTGDDEQGGDTGDGGDDEEPEVPIEDAVARIDTTYYATLQNAINAVPEGNVETNVYLLKTINENTTVPANKSIILDLDSNTINNNGNQEIMNIQGTITITGGTIDIPNSGAFANRTGATATISGGTLKSQNSGNTLLNEENATLTISDTAEILSNVSGMPALGNDGNLTITGGKVEAASSNAIRNDLGSITISGGIIQTLNSSHTIYNNTDGFIEIGGTAQILSPQANYANINNWGEMNITGGTITSQNSNALVNEVGATMRISGGRIESSSTDTNTVYNETDATMEISGTALITSSKDVSTYANLGTTTITGGTIESAISNAIINGNGGTLNVSGTATITGGNYGIYNYSSGIVNITGGNISSRYNC